MLSSLPSLRIILASLIFFIIIEEIAFYTTHRILHHPMMYSSVHKMHHAFSSPCAMSAIFCSPVEHLIANQIPIQLGPLILGSHLSTALLWYAIATVNTCISHSGYSFDFFSSAQFHDYHHANQTKNFGILGILDSIFHTIGGK